MEENTTTPTVADNQPIATKRCSKCGEVKPITEFHKRTLSHDGLQSWCKRCTMFANAKSHAINKDKITPPI